MSDSRVLLVFQPQRLAQILLVIGAAGAFGTNKLGFAHYLAQRLEIGWDLVTAPLTQGFTAHNNTSTTLCSHSNHFLERINRQSVLPSEIAINPFARGSLVEKLGEDQFTDGFFAALLYQ